MLAFEGFGASTPNKRNRDANSGASTAGADVTGAAPSNRVKSPRTAAAPVATADECGGAAGACTNSRKAQKTADAATDAQTMKAANRANMV